jgi:hypothetical protein
MWQFLVQRISQKPSVSEYSYRFIDHSAQ